MREAETRAQGRSMRGRIVAQAQPSNPFTKAPAQSMPEALERAGWTTGDVDPCEINGALAVVPMVAIAALGRRHDRFKVHGGACAPGHPIGAPAPASSSPCCTPSNAMA